MNKVLRSTLSAAFLVFAASSAQAEQVDYGAIGGNVVHLNNGALVPNGSAVLLGTFPSNFTFSTDQTFSQLSAAFTQYLPGTTIGDAGSGFTPGGFFATAGPVLPGTGNERLYIWVFNNAVPANATQWAIISNPASNWTRPPNTNPLGSTSIDISDLGTFIPTGAIGSVYTSAGSGINIGDIRLGNAPIPEPSTYVLALVGLGVAAGIARRRRQAVN